MMPKPDSLESAKAQFSAAVREGIDALMNKCGYSRERATSALLREISRGDSTRPSDEEVFQIMKRLGLGIEQATRTLVVGMALRRAMETCSPIKAVEQLTEKIALGNLMYDSSSEDCSSESEHLVIRADLRVKPVSRSERQGLARKSSPIKKGKSTGNKARARKSSALGRKRSIDEMASRENKDSSSFQNRQRADSAAEEVSVKMAKQSSDDNASSAGEPATRSSAVGVRAKRTVHRPDSSDAFGSTCNKRLRQNEV